MTQSSDTNVANTVRIISSGCRLGPVVELEPTRFGDVPFPSNSPWTAEQSAAYWTACLRLGGIDLVPIQLGSWHVSLDAIVASKHLEQILGVLLGDGVPSDVDEIGPLSGGFALVDQGEVLIEPTCCGDLSNLESWRTAARQRAESAEMIWIGHPWLSAKYRSPLVYINEEEEYRSAKLLRTFAVDPTSLTSAIVTAEAHLEAARDAVTLGVRNLVGDLDPRAVASLLLGDSR